MGENTNISICTYHSVTLLHDDHGQLDFTVAATHAALCGG